MAAAAAGAAAEGAGWLGTLGSFLGIGAFTSATQVAGWLPGAVAGGFGKKDREQTCNTIGNTQSLLNQLGELAGSIQKDWQKSEQTRAQITAMKQQAIDSMEVYKARQKTFIAKIVIQILASVVIVAFAVFIITRRARQSKFQSYDVAYDLAELKSRISNIKAGSSGS